MLLPAATYHLALTSIDLSQVSLSDRVPLPSKVYSWSFEESLQAFPLHLDLIWIDGGQYFGPGILSWLKDSFHAPICLFNVDDPTGPRDSLSFGTLKKPYYSLCSFVRQESSLEALALGAKELSLSAGLLMKSNILKLV